MPPLLDDQEKNRRRSFGLYLQQELERQKIKRTDLVKRLRAAGFQVADCRVWWSRLIAGKVLIPDGLPEAIEGVLQCDTQKWFRSPIASLTQNQRVVLLSAFSSSKRTNAADTLARLCLDLLDVRSKSENRSYGTFPINEGIPGHRLYTSHKDKEDGSTWQEHDAKKIRRSWGLGESAPIASVEQCIDDHTVPILYKPTFLKRLEMRDEDAIPAKCGKRRFIVMTDYERATPLYERRLAACKALVRVLVDSAQQLDAVERDVPDFDTLIAEALLLPEKAIELLLRDTFDAINQKALLTIEAIYGIPRKSVIARLILTKKISEKHARALDIASDNLPVLIKREKSIRRHLLDGVDFSRPDHHIPPKFQQGTLDLHIPPRPEASVSKPPTTPPTSAKQGSELPVRSPTQSSASPAPATSSQEHARFELELNEPSGDISILRRYRRKTFRKSKRKS